MGSEMEGPVSRPTKPVRDIDGGRGKESDISLEGPRREDE